MDLHSGDKEESKGVRDFFHNLASILKNRLGWPVFSCFFLAQLAMFLTHMMLVFTLVHFMHFSAQEKTWVLSLNMIVFAVASLMLSKIIKHLEKKPIALICMGVSVAISLLQFILYTLGVVSPGAEWQLGSTVLPVGKLVFIFLQMVFWAGWGLMVPLTNSMVADVSEVDRLKNGKVRDGSYAAFFNFFIKISVAIGNLISGFMLDFAGYESGAETQTHQTAITISGMTFMVAPVLLTLAFVIMWRYPLDRAFMEKVHKESAVSGGDEA